MCSYQGRAHFVIVVQSLLSGYIAPCLCHHISWELRNYYSHSSWCCYYSATCLPTRCNGWDRFCSDFDLVTDSLMGFYIIVDFQGLPIRKKYLVCFCSCCLAVCHLINGCQGDIGHIVTAYQVPKCSSRRGFFFLHSFACCFDGCSLDSYMLYSGVIFEKP